MDLINWQALLISIIIGLLVGTEREKTHSGQKTLGVRTFLLISLLGALAGHFTQTWLSFLVAFFSLYLIVLSYYLQTKNSSRSIDRGLTTEFAAGIVFCLGYFSNSYPIMAAIIGPLVALVLYSKPYLHRFTKEMSRQELEAALLLFLVAVIVVNILPNQNIDPWNLFNPQKFGFIVLILALLEFTGYVLTKIGGARKGAILAGFLGGFVSSTVVFLSCAKQAQKNKNAWRTQASMALAANTATFIELAFVVWASSEELFFHVIWFIGISIIINGGFIWILKDKKDHTSIEVKLKSPLDWMGVFRFSFIFAALFALVSFSKKWLGGDALFSITFLAGLFELQGVSLVNATLYVHGKSSLEVAQQSIALAICASLISKIVISWISTRSKFSYLITAIFLPLIILLLFMSGLFY